MNPSTTISLTTPTTDSIVVAAIPDELKDRAQWVLWRYEHRPGQHKPTKIPYNARRPQRRADATNPSTWSPFALAIARYDPFVMTALATGMDRAPLMRLCVKDVQLIYDKRSGTWHGTLFVRDKKTDGRPRSVAIADPICLALLSLLQGKGEDDQVFDGPPEAKENVFRARPLPTTAYQVRYWFGKARKKAGLEHVRFKDLRHSFATNALDAGLNVSELQAGLGHKRKETSLVYTKRDVTFDHEAALRVAKQMGLIEEENSYPDQAATA